MAKQLSFGNDARLKLLISIASFLSKNKARRWADFGPIPGSFENSLMAFSSEAGSLVILFI
jgi:hypothetical protein